MPQTKEGARKAVAKILARDPDHFKKLGRIGGKTPKTAPAGFAYVRDTDPEKFREISAKGGFISRRGKAKTSA